MRCRLISPIAEFAASVAALAPPPAASLLRALLIRIAANPGCGMRVEGLNVRVLQTHGFDGHPSLMLFYTFDDRAVYPLCVEPGDPPLP